MQSGGRLRGDTRLCAPAQKAHDLRRQWECIRRDATSAELCAHTGSAHRLYQRLRIVAVWQLTVQHHVVRHRGCGREHRVARCGTRLRNIDSYAKPFRCIERRDLIRLARELARKKHTQSRTVPCAVRRTVERSHGCGPFINSRNRHHETSQHPRVGTRAIAGVVRNSLVHVQRGRRKQSGVVHDSGHQRAQRRRRREHAVIHTASGRTWAYAAAA